MLLRDVTLRDGLQDEAPVPTEAKLRLLEAILAAGVRELEVTSFVRPDRVPAMADAPEVAARALALTGSGPEAPRLWALVPNRRGAERALAAGMRHLVFVLSVSEPHNLGNVGCSVDESFAALADVCRAAAGGGADVEVTLSTAFGCPHAGPVPAAAVVAAAARAAEAGAGAVNLADTIGTGVPTEVAQVTAATVAAVDPVPVGIHVHDTRGLGVANVLAAREAGAVRADGALGGLGGCPFAPGASGNVALEDLAHCLDAMGAVEGIDVDGLVAAAHLACETVGRPVASHVGVAGRRFGTLVPLAR